MNDKQVGESVMIFTTQERIEGTHVRMKAVRLSDCFTMMENNDEGIVKLTDATIYCRSTGKLMARSPFVLINRRQIGLVATDVVLA